MSGYVINSFGQGLKCCTPSFNCQVLRPVVMLALHGAHFGFDVKQLLKRIPSSATLSNVGIFIQSPVPYDLACLPQSSAIINSMLGRFLGVCCGGVEGEVAMAKSGAQINAHMYSPLKKYVNILRFIPLY